MLKTREKPLQIPGHPLIIFKEKDSIISILKANDTTWDYLR
jgi:hypothetical protein